MAFSRLIGKKNGCLCIVFAALLSATLFLGTARAEPQAQTAGQNPPARPIGSIKSISGNSLTLSTDAGATYSVSVEDSAKILRIEPGAKDLKNASPLQLPDLQVGDRILVMGKVSDDGHSIAATSVIVMKKADVASKQEHDRQDWQKAGSRRSGQRSRFVQRNNHDFRAGGRRRQERRYPYFERYDSAPLCPGFGEL